MSAITHEAIAGPASANGAVPVDPSLDPPLLWKKTSGQTADAARSVNSTSCAREIRRDLARRFGRKGGEISRLLSRFPLHEHEARGAYAYFTEVAQRESPDYTAASHPGVAALLDGLRRFGGSLSPSRLWPLWREGWIASGNAAASDPSSAVGRLLVAEALWASGILFESVRGSRRRMKSGRKLLLAEFDARTDSDGTPHADLLPVLPAWFASLVRTASWAKLAGERLWDAETGVRFEGLVRTVTVLTRPTGHLMTTSDGDLRPVLREAMKLTSWKAGTPARKFVAKLPRKDSCAYRPVGDLKLFPEKRDRKSPPVIQSDWAKLAVSRSRWSSDSDGFAVGHSGDLPLIEFLAFGRAVLAGDWDLSVRLDGRPLNWTADWEAVCWFSDRDADYLELQWTGEPGVTVCRQLLLPRGDHQLLVADAVSTPGRPETRIEVESRLPLSVGVEVESGGPGPEFRLDAGYSIRGFPLSSPALDGQSTDGSPDPRLRPLTRRCVGTGGVYLPTIFDWHPDRRSVVADWRSLTVTENHRRLGPAEASAYRLRIGDCQLFICRCLNGSKRKRTALGHHHPHESVVGRLTAGGDIEPLILVE